MQNAKMTAKRTITQFQLTQNLLNNLQQFNITPTAKLVLLYLSSCYNPKKAGMFPKQKTMSKKIGVSERSVIRAISELISEGLIIVECKYSNKYHFTSKIVCEPSENEKIFTSAKMSDKKRQNDIKENAKMSLPYIEPKKEHKKEPIGVDDYKILKDYAIKHNARNINAYINALKQSGSADKIIKDSKPKNYSTGEVERCLAIRNEVIEPLPPEYFANVRKRLFGELTPSAPF